MMRATIASRPLPRRVASLESPIFWLSGAIILLTFTLGSPVLNQIMPYSQPGGGFFAKFHPASWLTAPLLLLIWLDHAAVRRVQVSHLVWAIGLLALLIAWLALRGKGALAATFIDIHLTPAILLLALSRLPYERVRTLLALFVTLAAVNLLIVIVEFTIQNALLPREGYERFFRPAGLFSHPIVAGTLFYCAMFLASRGVVSAWLVRPLMLLFLMGVALCGVRGPLVMAGLIFLLHVIRPAVPRRNLFDYALDFGLVVFLPFGILAALYAGAFDRILELGFWDESAESRFLIFDALALLNDHQFWNGLDGYEVGSWLTKQTTGGQITENAFVSTIFQAGLPAALTLGLCLFVIYLPAMRQSPLFAAMVILVALTTLGFGVKNMIAAAVALSGYWVWRQVMERRR